MEHWELVAREQIRDLVARYNSNGDSGRFAQVLDLFADDAVMEIDGDRAYRGRAEIETVFTGARDRLRDASELAYMRHFTATHQIDVHDDIRAEGRCYYSVVTAIGLDHWGRYIDDYIHSGDRWLFSQRRVTVDGWAEGSFAGERA
ncbi:MAG: nuclear transport factor 2 family protein [Acidimicrobiia bacterium]|nr:nuclear transport factor 2 family protein [Acidimicrobiia bacterium]